MLIFRFQKELLVKTDKTADVVNHDTIVSDGHRSPSKSPQEKRNGSNHLSVSDRRTLATIK